MTTLLNEVISADDTMLIVFKHGTISAKVVKVTEKAIQIGSSDSKIKVWLPKAAITVNKDFFVVVEDFSKHFPNVEIAKWFKGDKWFDKFFDDSFYPFNIAF
jgi:hypothetical protein